MIILDWNWSLGKLHLQKLFFESMIRAQFLYFSNICKLWGDFDKKTLTRYCNPIQYASFGTFNTKIGRLFSPRNFRYWFLSKTWTDFSFEGFKRSVLNGATIFCKSYHHYDRFLRNCGPLKIKLFQRLRCQKKCYKRGCKKQFAVKNLVTSVLSNA